MDWIRRIRAAFSGRDDILGRTIVLDGRGYRIVGVMPAGFGFPDRDTRVWLAFRIPPVVDPARPEARSMSMFSALARLRPGVSVEQAASEATARARSGPDPGLVAEAVFGVKGSAEVRPALKVFLAAVGLLLATAVGNVALLRLAQVTNRRREIAIRVAIGAGLGRLMRQMLVESAVLGLAGGMCGWLVAAWLHRLLPFLLPADFPRLADIALDWRVAAFALGLSLVASVGFGLLAASQARRVNLVESLAEDGLAPVGGSFRSPTARARLLIMAAQIAAACVLLVGAGLLKRSFAAMAHADRGYDPSNLLTARIPIPKATYTDQQRLTLLNRLAERLRIVPGVVHAAFASSIPLSCGSMLSAFSFPRNGKTITIRASQRQVSADYFAALGIRLLQGRLFTQTDTVTAASVMIVNRAFATQYLDEGSACSGRSVTAWRSARGRSPSL